jgi:hypothetical protein
MALRSTHPAKLNAVGVLNEERGLFRPPLLFGCAFLVKIDTGPSKMIWLNAMRDCAKQRPLILNEEESFARAVALGVIVKRPPSAWHFLLPGMFLFDFLRRSSETRRYSELFLFPRRLALDGAFDLLNGEDRKKVFSQAEEGIKRWLITLKLDSERLLRAHMSQVALLVDHYTRLLQAEAGSYHGLIRQVYSDREHYETFLGQLSAAEQEVDQAVAAFHGGTEAIWHRLQAEQAQVEALRKKEILQCFD